MDERHPIWQRLVIVSHRLTRLCDVVAGELMYNRARRDAWFANTVAWKKAWLYGEDDSRETTQRSDETRSKNPLVRP